MKIRIRELRKLIKEEVRRAASMNEAMWGGLEGGMDPTLEKIKQILKSTSSAKPPLVTKIPGAGESPSYWFNIMNLSDSDVNWLMSELQSIPGAEVSEEMGKIIVAMPNSVKLGRGRDPAGQSVWDAEE